MAIRVYTWSQLRGAVLAGVCLATCGAPAQDAAPPPPASAVSIPAPPGTQAAPPPKQGKKGKEVYTGPTNTVALEPTPMLDEEGRQRLDPDGKPMFNPPVIQQRDKKGHPVFDDKGQPVFQSKDDLGYDERGKKLHSKKEKASKTVSVAIEHGTLTLDGLTGKAQLNYDIKDLKYIYFYAPWVGLTIVSLQPFPGSTLEKNAFAERSLTVSAGEHIYQLSSDRRLLGKKPESAYVRVDRDFNLAVQFPIMGYGSLRQAPYAWPGSKDVLAKGTSAPPPLPVNMRPAALLPPCPTGQMRPSEALVAAGQAPPPCVAIAAKPASH